MENYSEEYIPDMTFVGTPEDNFRMGQYGIPARPLIHEMTYETCPRPKSVSSRRYPVQTRRLEERQDEYEKASPCKKASYIANKEHFGAGNQITVDNQMVVVFLVFLAFVFLIVHFNNNINELKMIIKNMRQ